MRVTQQTKEETRIRILKAAQQLFRSEGFAETRTKQIAQEAGIAAGTLFNYFPTKEAVAAALADGALQAADTAFRKQADVPESLEEALFAYIATGLRKLRPHRSYISAIPEQFLNPLTENGPASPAACIRTRLLETLAELMHERGFEEPATSVECQLFQTLYTGILSFWGSDRSPHQEDTLALLDQSIRMFVNWLQRCRT